MALEWAFIEIFIITVEVCALFYLLCSKFVARYNTFIPTLFFSLINIFLVAFPMFIGLYNLPIPEIIAPLICFAYLLLFREGSTLRKIFWIVIAFVLLFSIAIFSINIMSFLSAANTSDIVEVKGSTERLLTVSISKSLQVIIFYALSKKKRSLEVKNLLSPIPIIVCFLIPLISFTIIMVVYILMHSGIYVAEELSMLISAGLLAINIIVFVLYEIISREAMKNYVLVAKNKQYELTEQHNQQVIEMYHKMRSWRHDYASHMQTITGILEKAETDEKVNEAIYYIENLDEKITKSSIEIVTGNYIVDAIVSAKATLASAHNISLEHNILLFDEINMEDTDLCSILSNLLDNAIEACCKLEHGRYINFEMILVKAQLNIKIVNASDGKYKIERGIFKTTKRGDLHGIGIGHIKSIVENYDGFFEVKPEANSFSVQIEIPLVHKKI